MGGPPKSLGSDGDSDKLKQITGPHEGAVIETSTGHLEERGGDTGGRREIKEDIWRK